MSGVNYNRPILPMESGAICHTLKRYMVLKKGKKKRIRQLYQSGSQQPNSGRFFQVWLKRLHCRWRNRASQKKKKKKKEPVFVFLLFFPPFIYLFIFFLSATASPARSRMDEFTHHARRWIMERAGTASRNHLLPDSFHLFIFMGLFFFLFNVRRVGVGSYCAEKQQPVGLC